MADLRKLNISTEELSKATNLFHVDIKDTDLMRIDEAYPQLLVQEVMSEFNQQTNEYVAKQLVSLNIDKDVLLKQTQEIQRLNNKIANMKDMTQKMLKEQYCKAIDDLLENANEMAIEVDTGTYTMKAIGIGLLEQIAEQLKAGGENGKKKYIELS